MKTFLLPCVAILLFGRVASAQVSSGFRQTYVPQYVPLPLETFKESARIKEAQYEAKLEACQEEIATLYKEASNYPQIADGRHLVNIVGPGTCNEMYVIVQQGKVSSIVKSNGEYMTKFTISTQVNSGKSKVGIPDSETGIADYYHIIFLKDIYGQ